MLDSHNSGLIDTACDAFEINTKKHTQTTGAIVQTSGDHPLSYILTLVLRTLRAWRIIIHRSSLWAYGVFASYRVLRVGPSTRRIYRRAMDSSSNLFDSAMCILRNMQKPIYAIGRQRADDWRVSSATWSLSIFFVLGSYTREHCANDIIFLFSVETVTCL